LVDHTIDLNFVDLALGIEKDRAEDWFWAYNRLALDRDPEMFQLILDAPSSEIPAGLVVVWYCNDRPSPVTTHTYGGPLRLILAGDLAAAMRSRSGDLSPWNNAVLGMVGAMPSDMRIVLFWN
jgi:hypothetical protein